MLLGWAGFYAGRRNNRVEVGVHIGRWWRRRHRGGGNLGGWFTSIEQVSISCLLSFENFLVIGGLKSVVGQSIDSRGGGGGGIYDGRAGVGVGLVGWWCGWSRGFS